MSTAEVRDRRLVLVGLERGGITGWGEAAPWPGVTVETVDEVWEALVELDPEGLGQLPVTAAAALDEADLDQQARVAELPLWEMIGGTSRLVPASPAIGMKGSIGELEGAVAEAVEVGYRGVKLKIKPGWDVAPVKAIRALFPFLRIGVDANGAYSDPSDKALRALRELNLQYIEQPLPKDDLVGNASLRATDSTPICLDESVESVTAAQRIISAEAADIISLKPGRLGLRGCLVVHDIARRAGIRLKAAGLLDSAIGRGHMLAVGSLAGVEFWDLATGDWYFNNDVVDNPWELFGDGIALRPAVGIGVELSNLQDHQALRSRVIN